MTPETPTPETDLEEANQTQRFGGYMVKASFARQLERERDAARAEIASMREAIREAHDMVAEHIAALDWPALDDHELTAALAKLKSFIK